jgi:hypothetical protein
MTVAELIRRLKELPASLEVVLHDDSGNADLVEACTVRVEVVKELPADEYGKRYLGVAAGKPECQTVVLID